MKRLSKSSLTLALLSLSVFPSNLRGASAEKSSAPMPIIFETNMGQAPSQYGFLSRHGNVETLFRSSGVDLLLPDGANGRARIGFRLLGSDPDSLPQGLDVLPSVSHYLVGPDPSRWIHNVPNYSQVFYSSIYPGIDLIFHGRGAELEHDFRIAAGADPGLIHFAIEGARSLRLDSEGDLAIQLGDDTLFFKKPLAYQQTGNGRKAIESHFLLNADLSVEFQVGEYDRSVELVIDPVFSFSSYLASTSGDNVTAVTTDSTGNIYVTGYTGIGFPIVNGIQPTINGSQNAFISKLDPSGEHLLYSTYLGGSSANYGAAIALDSKGNIIVAGSSSSNDFPHAGDVQPPPCNINASCYFVASLTSNGSAFNYAGLIGGFEGSGIQSSGPGAGSIAVDSAGNVYLTGVTSDPSFQTTPGTLSPVQECDTTPCNSTFVMKVNPSGALVYSTFIPGTAAENLSNSLNNVFVAAAISVNANGEATIAGTAGPGLPSTAGVVLPTFPSGNLGGLDSGSAGFLLQLNATASAINYATYVPGTDSIGGYAVDSHGNSYVAGGTSETTLPVSSNAYQKTLKAGEDCTCNGGFIVALNATGTTVLAATYLEGTPSPGNAGTNFTGLALDSNTNVFVGGMTGSIDFPLVDPFTSQWVLGETAWDMVVAEMSSDLSSLLFGSFLSPTDQTFSASQFSALAVDTQANFIVVGQTVATDFPTTPQSYQPVAPESSPEYQIGFVAKFNMATPAPSVCLSSWSVNFNSVNAKQASTQTVNITNCGNAALSITSMVSSASTVAAQESCGSELQAGAVCPVSLTYTPLNSSVLSGTLTITDNAQIPTQVISLFGQGVAPQLSPSSGSVNFGHLLVNTSGAGNQLFFWNTGNATLSISSASINGDFTINQNLCIGSLQPNSPCWITVTFSPTAAGIRTGTLTIVSNDPVYPQAGISLVGVGDTVYAAPVIGYLGSPTAQINNGPIVVQVGGANFYPASVIAVNGIAQSTTYSNGGGLQATLSSAVSSAIGEVAVTVVNPSPGGGTSVAVPLTLYEVINIDAAFITSVPGSQFIYASVPSSSATNPNTVVPINSATGALGTPIPVGNNPGLLAASGDGSYLFVVANQDATVQRIDLATQAVDQTFPFPPNSSNCCGSSAAADLKAVPGSPQEVVLALDIQDYGYAAMALYNGTGLVNYVPTTTNGAIHFSSFAYAGNPPTIYALPFTSAQNSFFNVITINAQGLQFTPYTGGNYTVNDTTGAEVVSDGTLLYTSAGEVWNPTTQSQVGTFPVTNINDTSYPNLYSMVMDTTSGHIFLIGDENSITLSAYSQSALNLTGTLAFPQVVQPLVESLLHWGSNGFAFLGQTSTASSQQVFLVTSSLAVPVTSNPVPQLTSVNPTSTPQNTNYLQLTLNGQGFTEASLVMWNGTALPTTYADSTVLTAMVPATDLAASGTASITVSTPAPGGGTSSASVFTISPLAPLLSFSSSAITFSNQTVATSSVAQTIAVQNPATATLNISAISVTGSGAASFQQTTTCGSTLAASANCAVSLVFTPTAAASQNASLIFTDNASGSPQAVPISGTGTAGSLGLGASSTGSTSATVAAGATATYSLVIGGGGIAGTSTLTCANAPKGATCSVPGSINLKATSTTPLTVTVTTTSSTSGRLPLRHTTWFWATTVFGLLMLPGARRKQQSSRWVTGLPFLLLILICSCGGGSMQTGSHGNPNGTPPGQYTLVVTATAGSSTQSLSLNLTVQ
jgi:hypothetical protein